jgi:hypothetical protein
MMKKAQIFSSSRAVRRKQELLSDIWVTYLRFSPSYEIARKIRTNELPKSHLKKMPADFDKVLQVYDDFGDIRFINSYDWYLENKRRLFGVMPEALHISTITRLKKGKNGSFGGIADELFKYSATRGIDTNQRINLAAIPLDRKKSELMKEFSEYLDRHGVKAPDPEDAKYTVQKGLQTKATINALKVIWLHAYMPNISLWEIGAISDVSRTFSKQLSSLEKTRGNEEARYLMTITVAKLLKRALLIAENAAYGRFPSDKPTTSTQEFDWQSLTNLLQYRKSKLKPDQEYYF